MAKILVIDDKQDNLTAVCAVLGHSITGCTLITAQSGAEGIHQAKTEAPDTILLDVKMPGMDGFEVCKKLKSDPETKHIPIIMFTAVMKDTASQLLGFETGADAYLSKPVEPLLLAGQVKIALRMKKAEDQLRKENILLTDTVAQKTSVLEETQNRFQSLVEHSNDHIFMMDEQGKYLWSNNRVETFGLQKGENLIGKHLQDVYPPEVAMVYRKKLAEVFASCRSIAFEHDIPGADDTVYHIDTLYPIFHQEQIQAVGGICHDITEKRKADVQKKELEKRLFQAQKMESIGTLAGGIAHDFNNILFPIVGYTEMLLEDIPEDSPFRYSLNQIYTSALRARNLVKQILTFARQEHGELILMKMQPIIKEALKLIRSTIPTTIEIKQDINPDCGVIKADPTQIHQIVMNLTTNAYHAMEETGGELKVSLKEVEFGPLDRINPNMAPGIYACLTIADTGVGMDKTLTDKIFDPFFTTKAIGKGTGMGLSVVHGIVAAMGGAIHVYSEPGKGTQFHVYLPVEKSLSETQVTNSEAEIQGGTEPVLLVDDEEAILAMGKQMLEHLGYQVTLRTSSLEALEAFRDSPDKFDLVITDMAMPNMSGDKLSDALTKIRPDIPILLCTGFSENMSEEKATSLGIKGFLLKPIVMKDLAQKMREVLDEN